MRLPPSLPTELRRAWPYALLLALGLGTVVSVGSHLSNAFPSESRPFGWPGPSDFDNGVAMVRSHLVLATTLPALLMGVSAVWRRDPREEGLPRLGVALGVDAGLILAAVTLAAGAGAVSASETTGAMFGAFVLAHALLALAVYALSVLAASLAGGAGAAVAGGLWVLFHAAYEDATRLAVYRTAGFNRLVSGDLPTWFLVAQGLSPLEAYRGVLILAHRGFMNYEEQVILGEAALPAWVNPWTFAALIVGLWILLPLGLAALAWWWRGRDASAPAKSAQAGA